MLAYILLGGVKKFRKLILVEPNLSIFGIKRNGGFIILAMKRMILRVITVAILAMVKRKRLLKENRVRLKLNIQETEMVNLSLNLLKKDRPILMDLTDRLFLCMGRV